MTENIILIDWFTFTIRGDLPDLKEVISFLGLTSANFVERNGHYGYRSALYLGGIWIMYDGRDGMGLCVEMSGQGCRQFETSSLISFAELFEKVTANLERYHVTRLDVAFDDIDKEGSGLLDIVKICKSAYQGRYISKFSKSHPEVECVTDEKGHVTRAHSCYFGAPSSEVRIRFYDKAQERGGLDYHWVRCELQLRDEKALAYLQQKVCWGERFYGVLNNYLRFIIPNKSDTNRRRWSSPSWWEKFLLYCNRISLYTAKGVDYNLTRLERYIIDQCGNSIETYIKCVGELKFKEMLKHRDSYLNANQQALVFEYQNIRQQQLNEYRQRHPWG